MDDHHRVSPQGKAMGKSASRIAELGRARLAALGLDGAQAPMLRAEMCKSCACQPGSVPNGCLQTQLDFLKSVHEGTPFRCHAPMDGKMCAGWVRARAEVVANPLPRDVVTLLDKWEYTPPDAAEIGGGVMRRNTNPNALNNSEPRPAMILRLLTEAQAGKASDVSLADALEFRRDQYGLKAAEFAAILGLTPPKYSEVISGKRNMPLNARIRAFAIGVPAEVLLQPGSEMVRQSRAQPNTNKEP